MTDVQQTICLQCGDKGFDNAFVYCVRCLEYAVHRYCLDVIPKTLDEFVPWICDDCQVACEPCNRILESSKKNRILSVKPIGEEENQDIVSAKCYNVTEGLDIENHGAETNTEDRTMCPDNSHLVNRGLDARNDLDKYASTSSMMNLHGCAEPIFTPSWSGSFDMWSESRIILSGLRGHISSKACEKVYKETNLLQSVIHLEMHRQSDIWPKSFKKSPPCDENIAIFFFPSATSEQAYAELVDSMMNKEVALRGVVKNAEILVFTSSVLPLIYHQFKNKCYLWGVFRAKAKLPSCSDS